MLELIRRRNESIVIGDDVEVVVAEITGEKVRLGVVAPKQTPVYRREVYESICQEKGLPIRPRPELVERREDDLRRLRAERVTSLLSKGSTPEHVNLRVATELDLVAINDIYNYYVANSTCTYQEDPEPIEGRREWFARHGAQHPVTVATIDGRVVGWGSLSPYHSRCAYRNTVESSVYVHHEFHRRGIGSLLLKDLIERARVIGHRTIIGAIDGSQSASIALHAKFGFHEVGHFEQVGFKFNRWLDVIYMQLLL